MKRLKTHAFYRSFPILTVPAQWHSHFGHCNRSFLLTYLLTVGHIRGVAISLTSQSSSRAGRTHRHTGVVNDGAYTAAHRRSVESISVPSTFRPSSGCGQRVWSRRPEKERFINPGNDFQTEQKLFERRCW